MSGDPLRPTPPGAAATGAQASSQSTRPPLPPLRTSSSAASSSAIPVSGAPQSPRAIQFVDDLVDTTARAGPLSPRAAETATANERQQPPLQDPLSPSFASPTSRQAANQRQYHRRPSLTAAASSSSTSSASAAASSSSNTAMPLHSGYGSTASGGAGVSSGTGSALRDPFQEPTDTPTRTAGPPGRIQMPPSPYATQQPQDEDEIGEQPGSLQPFRPRAASMSPSVSTNNGSLRPPGQRRMSFKRRAAPSAGNQRGGNFLHRASMGVFPSRKASDAGSESAYAANWRKMRRVHTASAHPGANSGDNGNDDPDGGDSVWAGDGLPSIPRLLPSSKPDPYSTPIPTLPFVVLCLVVFGEFSSSGVAGPFLFFMIEDFGVSESDVGFWAGIVSSAFFFAQFLTSLMWASVAEKRGRRFVLMVSLIGNASSLVLFGTSKNVTSAIFIRMAQGFFNGAVGVAKGAIRDITDETNEGRAYAQMGFYWGMGGIVGPILGGLLEHPVKKYPSIFGNSTLFASYPYLLPCIAAAFFTALGAFFSLFIGYDGGPRTGSIQLPEKADVGRATSQMASNVSSIGRSASKRISGYFAGAGKGGDSESLLSLSRTNTQHEGGPSTPRGQQGGKALPRTFTQQVDDETGGPPSPVESEAHTIVTRTNNNDSGFDRIESQYRQRLFSRTEERQRNVLGGGSAYGYEARRPSRSSNAFQLPPHRQSTSNPRHESFANSAYDRNARPSFSSQNAYAPDFEDIGARPNLNFAQRFLLAQDDSVFTISDLWVAAAINGEDAYEDVFEDDEDEDDIMTGDEDDEDGDVFDEGRSSVDRNSIDQSISEEDEDGPTEGSPLLAPKHLPPLNFAQRKLSRGGAFSDAGRSASSSRPRSYRRSSAGRVPSLYANTGIEGPLLSPGSGYPFSPSASMVANPLGGTPGSTQQSGPASRPEGAWDPTLAGIPETQSNRNSLSAATPMLRQTSGAGTTIGVSPDRRSKISLAGTVAAPPPSLFAVLPVAIIAHYGLMAFHSSTFDQVFMAFLVSPEASGGLGLTASHYAELIAAMACCQLVFQFVFYPKVGPPQGKLSHLAMLRLGTAIYLPCYTLFPWLRTLLHPETDGYVMAGMIFAASLRWLANVCAFTAVSVLINAMTPPHLTPLANGLAQTTSSALRFLGPILGGILWAEGLKDGRSWPFNYHIGFWFVGLAGFTGFLLSWRIK